MRSVLTTLGIAIAVAAVAWVVALGHESASRCREDLEHAPRRGPEAIARAVPLVHRISPQVDGTMQLVSERSNWTTRSRVVFTTEDVTRAQCGADRADGPHAALRRRGSDWPASFA